MEQRHSTRVQRAFTVSVTSDRHGHSYAIARNVSSGGILVETNETFPLGTPVQVQFLIPEAHAEITFHGEVKHRFSLNFSTKGQAQKMTAMGIRFVSFARPVPPTVELTRVQPARPILH